MKAAAPTNARKKSVPQFSQRKLKNYRVIRCNFNYEFDGNDFYIKSRLETWFFQNITLYTDMGSIIGNFVCGYSIVWKFSNFAANAIWFYVKSILAAFFRRSRTALLTIFQAKNFDFLVYFSDENVKNLQKLKIQTCSNSQNGSFMDQNWFHLHKIWVAENSWNFHILYSQLGCPGL